MLEKLNHYSITSPASVYDEEALTALQLVARLAAKVNEAIDVYNKLETETGDKLAAQNEFIKKMNEITMPAEVRAEVNRFIESGAFDTAISVYLDDLEERLDNLVNSVPEGSTTMDAEIIDARVGEDGVTRSNLGASTRVQFENMRFRSACAAGVFFNKTPVLTFAAKSNMTFTAEGMTHILFEGYRYDVENLTISATTENMTKGQELFRIYFNPKTKELVSLWMERAPKDYIFIGLIFRDTYYFVNQIVSVWNDFTTDKKPLYAQIYLDGTPSVHSDHNTTLEIPAAFIFYNRQRISVEATSIDASRMDDGTLCSVLFNLRTNTYSITSSSAVIPSDCVHVGLIHRTTGVHFNTVNDYKWDYRRRASLLMSGHDKVVSIDTTAKTITFPRDTLILYNNGFGILGNDITKNAIASYEDIESSAVCVYLDRYTHAIYAKAYTYHPSQDEIMLCTFRTSTGVCDLSVPYKVNGKLFNIIPLDEANNVNINGGSSETSSHVKAIAHRGLSSAAPENTLAAFRAAKNAGFDYVECDIQFTSDGEPVLLHDSTIDRTSNGSGNISEIPLATVKSFDFGSWFSDKFTGEKIPTFKEFMSFCKSNGLHAYVEIKSGTEEQILNVMKIIKMYGMRENVTYISFNMSVLRYVIEYDKYARIGYNFEQSTLGSNVVLFEELQTGYNEVFVNLASSAAVGEIFMQCADAFLGLEVWTVDDESFIATMNPYITGVTSNTLHAGKILNERTLNGEPTLGVGDILYPEPPSSGGSGDPATVFSLKTVPVTGTFQFNENIVETGAVILDETTVDTIEGNYLEAFTESVIEAKENGNTRYIIAISANLDGTQVYMVQSFLNREMTEEDETLYQFAYGAELLNNLSNRTFEIVDSGAFGGWILANATKVM